MHRWNAAVKRNSITGNATAQYEGEDVSAVKTLAGFSADQVIAEGGTGMTEAKVKAVRSNFVKKKALQGGQRIYLGISQNEEDTLTAVTNFIDEDRIDKGAIESGVIAGRLYGVTLIRDEDLNVSGTTRTCPAWVKTGVLFGNQQGIFTRNAEIQNRHYMREFYLRVDNGATRTRESDAMSVLTLTTA